MPAIFSEAKQGDAVARMLMRRMIPCHFERFLNHTYHFHMISPRGDFIQVSVCIEHRTTVLYLAKVIQAHWAHYHDAAVNMRKSIEPVGAVEIKQEKQHA